MTSSGPGVERRLQALERVVFGGSLSFSMGPTSTVAADDSATQVSELRSEVHSLRATLQALQARSGEDAYKIAGIPFQLREDTVSWVSKENVGRFPFYFLDPISLLQVMETGAEDANAMVKAAYKGDRVNLDGDLEVGVAYSFLVEVPTVLGGTLKAECKNPKSLDRLKEILDFESEGSYDMGLCKTIENNLKS